MRQLPATMHIPVVIYSALPKEEVEKLLPAGHDCVILTKPCSPDEVVQTVKKILN